MKKYFSIALFIVFFTQANAQNISLKELMNFRTMDMTTLTDNLLRKNFNYVGIFPNPSTKEDLYTWAYDFDSERKKATVWFHKYTTNKDGVGFLTGSKSNYLQFKKEMEQNGFKLISSEIGSEGELISEYTSKNYFIKIDTHTTQTTWSIFLRKK